MIAVVEKRQGTRPWGEATSAIVRHLFASPEGAIPSQGQLARTLGITQPRVSQVLRMLADHGALPDAPDTRAHLVELYVEHHRPEVISEMHWCDFADG